MSAACASERKKTHLVKTERIDANDVVDARALAGRESLRGPALERRQARGRQLGVPRRKGKDRGARRDGRARSGRRSLVQREHRWRRDGRVVREVFLQCRLGQLRVHNGLRIGGGACCEQHGDEPEGAASRLDWREQNENTHTAQCVSLVDSANALLCRRFTTPQRIFRPVIRIAHRRAQKTMSRLRESRSACN